MNLNLISIDKFLGKDLLNYHISNEQETLDRFQVQLNQYINTIQKRNENSASEGNQAGVFKDLLSDFYKYDVRIDHNKIDLSIWDSEHLKVIIEAKREANSPEMISDDNIDKKAFYEALFYYCEQSLNENQHLIKNIIITDFIKLYIFDSRQFLDLISVKKFKETFLEFQKDKDGFYKKMPLLSLSNTLEACKIDLFDENLDIKSLYKILDKHSLLGTPLENKDHNVLDKDFYNELLYIMGMEEKLEDNIPVIKPILIDNADNHSLHTMTQQKLQGINTKIPPEIWLNLADTEEDRYFTLALELILTWINRILFLKLLEAQLISYHPQEQKEHYKFLDSKKLSNWQEVSSLFFDILAKPLSERDKKEIPYLNSSLFERTAYENILGIDSFNPNDKLIPYEKTILKDKKPRPTLQYLLEFLDCYNFGMGDDNLSESKRLINASVLGLVFEKINGYKDGAVYTPSFITMSMSKEALRHTILQKFNDTYHWNCADFTALKNKIVKDDSLSLDELNKTFNSIRICDPAVGSGHFLVSVLNELLLIKYELKILCNAKGEILSHCDMNIAYDELFIKYNGKDFKYQVDNKNLPLSKEVQNLQETLFHEKETIIENCLFGVDINPKSAYICQLRLWIELLKNTYYIQDSDTPTNLQTLPNIDINIKIGNSLVSRFNVKQNFSHIFTVLKRLHDISIDRYRELVYLYKSTANKEQKILVKQEIENIKIKLKESFLTTDDTRQKIVRKISNATNEIEYLSNPENQMSSVDIDILKQKLNKWNKELEENTLKLRKADNIYKNSLEWRYEFPEVLDDNGNFLGFDLIIGNPPYFRYGKMTGSHYMGESDYLRSQEIYSVACKGEINAYEVFLLLSYLLCKDKGFICKIFQQSFLADRASSGVRNFYMENTSIIHINSFPERDNHKKRVFENVKMSVLTLLTHKNNRTETFPLDIYPDRMETAPKKLNIDMDIVRKIDSESMEIPNLNEIELKIFDKCYSNTNILRNYCSFSEGELHQTSCKKYFTDDATKTPFYVGANVQKYYITDTPSQRTLPLYFDKELYLSEKPKRKEHIENDRLVCQGIAGVNDKFRLIFGIAPSNVGLGNSVNYMVLKENVSLDIYYLMGLLNSWLLNWLFKARSTNANINNYELERLPIPQATAEQQAPIIDLVKQCMTAKANNKNADITHLQSQIDKLVYSLYGLTDDEISIVEGE